MCDPRPPCVAATVSRIPTTGLPGLAGDAGLLGREHQLFAGLFELALGRVGLESGLDYQYTRYEYENVDSRNRDLHRLQFPFRFESPFDGWTLHGLLAPGISTSSNVFKDYINRGNSGDAFVTGRLVGRWDVDGRSWFFGAAHDRSFGRSAAYPTAGVELMPSATLSLRVAYPDPGLRVVLSDRQAVEVSLFPAGHQWNVATDDFARRFDYRVKTWRAHLVWKVRLRASLSVDLSLGYDFRREHKFLDDLGRPLQTGVEDRWLFGIGFRARTAVSPVTHGGHL